jgi:hypothetical protein
VVRASGKTIASTAATTKSSAMMRLSASDRSPGRKRTAAVVAITTPMMRMN